MKIGRYYNQGANGGNLPTEYGTYTSPYITVDKSEYRYQKPGPPLMLRGRHEHRTQPRPVGIRSMVERHPASLVPTGFNSAGGSLGSFNGDPNMGTLSGTLFSDSPAIDPDYADRTDAHYEQGNPQDAIALGSYPGPAMLATKVKSLFSKPLVLALLLGVGGYLLYRLFVKPALLPNPPTPGKRQYKRYRSGSRKRKPAHNKKLSTFSRGRPRNSNGTFKSIH